MGPLLTASAKTTPTPNFNFNKCLDSKTALFPFLSWSWGFCQSWWWHLRSLVDQCNFWTDTTFNVTCAANVECCCACCTERGRSWDAAPRSEVMFTSLASLTASPLFESYCTRLKRQIEDTQKIFEGCEGFESHPCANSFAHVFPTIIGRDLKSNRLS